MPRCTAGLAAYRPIGYLRPSASQCPAHRYFQIVVVIHGRISPARPGLTAPVYRGWRFVYTPRITGRYDYKMRMRAAAESNRISWARNRPKSRVFLWLLMRLTRLQVALLGFCPRTGSPGPRHMVGAELAMLNGPRSISNRTIDRICRSRGLTSFGKAASKRRTEARHRFAAR